MDLKLLNSQETKIIAVKKKTLVIGASAKSERASNQLLHMLHAYGKPVVAIGNTEEIVAETEIQKQKLPFEDIDTVSLYLRASRQDEFIDYIFSLKPKRIIFNPGAENPDFQSKAQALGIEAINACSLVMISTGQY